MLAVVVSTKQLASAYKMVSFGHVKTGTSGTVVSSMVKVADVVEVLLHSSVTVKITVDEPVKPQSSLKATKSLLQVYVPHTSEAAPALPLAESQPFKSDRLPAPSHSTVKSMASDAMAGSVVSSMVKVAVVVLVFPQSSVAENITVADPVAPQSSLNAMKLLAQV